LEGGTGGRAFAPHLNLKIVTFCVLHKELCFFLHILPPLESGSKVCPPLEKTEMTSLDKLHKLNKKILRILLNKKYDTPPGKYLYM